MRGYYCKLLYKKVKQNVEHTLKVKTLRNIILSIHKTIVVKFSIRISQYIKDI